MTVTIEISVVVLIAATMALFSLLIGLIERRNRTLDVDLKRANTWLCGSNVGFLVASITLLFHHDLPFWLSVCIIIAGAHLGILFGFFAMHQGLKARPPYGVFAVICSAIIGLQWAFVLSGTRLPLLFVSTSVINGLVTATMGVIILRLSRPYERELRLLVCFPFFVIAVGYALRLVLAASGVPTSVLVTATALIAFVLAYSALQWCFGLIALRAARLNRSLTLERQRAQDLAESRARFLAHMSHEIRTPLNSVLGLADVLHGMVRQPEARELIGHIQQSGDLLIRILNDILDVSKLEANAVTLEQRPFDINALLHRIIATHGAKCQDRRLALEVDMHPEAGAFWLGDAHRIDQILQNVVGNAVKFTEAGSVRVSASGTDQLQLLVVDTGIGMTEAQIALMFKEFSQADEGITRRFGGTGLGMAIVHRLVTAMGGTIQVQSQFGKGTRFTIVLPLSRSEPARPALVEVQPLPTVDVSTLTVLCADDSKGNLMVLRAMLQQLGIEPHVAEDGHTAIAIAEHQPFDVYLLDISMPGFSGIETLHRLRLIENDQLRPPAYAAAATANALALDLAQYLSAGFDAHLPKPIRLEALRAVLEASLAAQCMRAVPPGALAAGGDQSAVTLAAASGS
ncbi:ATP-binding protein [Pseudotabrizicola sp. 4114]|uniref:ATP-binding protein n=1 Tax=Pseudotabrizicola sp. 4114 TaxID=2817731 RepID=UPI0028615428|nr:signal transduction histidine kinase/ActR/RegA family two-component response regulator [Pseudorhodobacter sp. 4114]